MTFTPNNDHLHNPAYCEAILDTIAVPVVIQAPDFKLIFANKEACKLLPGGDFSQESGFCFCHKILFQLDAPCSDLGMPCPMSEALAHKRDAVVVRRIQAVDGLEKWLEIKAQPLFDEAGDVFQVIETITDITQSKEMSNALVRYNRSQEEFFLASRKINTITDLKKLYRHIVSHARELLQVDFSTLMLFSEDRKGLIIHDTIGFPESTIDTFAVMEGQGLAPYVAKTKIPDTVVDFYTETRFEVPKLIADRNIRSAICVPMIIADEVLGVLVGHTLQQRTFTDHEIILYDNLANQAAMALHSAQSLKELRASEDRYHDLFENSLDLIQMIGPEGQILYVNKAWKNTLGYSEEEIPGLSAFDIIDPEDRDHCMLLFQKLKNGEAVHLTETNFVTKEGKIIPVEGHINTHTKNGELISTRGIFRDITERKIFEERLKEISITDHLTGLLNRRGFMTLAAKQLAIAERTKKSLHLLYADLDNMKWINDKRGHKIGDQALKETADLFTSTFRSGDIIARIGGDEFIILLTETNVDEDEHAEVKRFNEKLKELNQQKDRMYDLLISIGVVKFDGNNPCTLEELITQADKKMYEHKRRKNSASDQTPVD